MKANVGLTRHGGGLRAKIDGTIEADFDPKELMSAHGVVVVDLDGVTRITSFGVREWIRTWKNSSAESIYFLNAHASMVAQFNLVDGFAGRGVLVSCYLPYICTACEEETERKLDLAADFDIVRSGNPPAMTCPKCGAEAEFDDSPQTFFSFMRQQPPPVLSEIAKLIITGERGAPSETITVRKEVDGAVTGVWLKGPLDARARFRRAVDGVEGHVVVVCAGLHVVDEAGANKLIDLRALPGAQVVFARVRMDMLRAIPGERRGEMAGSVVSLLWPMHCDVCNERTAGEISAPFHDLEDGVPARCEKCGTPGVVQIKSTREVILKFFLAKSLPIEIASYLRERPGELPALSVAVDPDTSGSGRHGAASAGPSKYRILRPLGEGGMAEVFLAEHVGPEGFRKKVVLKKILPKLEKKEEFVRMFLQEARVAARVNHPNVVQIFDLGQENGRHFMAMEYVKGYDLRTILNAVGHTAEAFPVDIACRIAADICAGLHAAHTCIDETHKHGIVHRDVSPHNVLIALDGAVKISDFGISKVEDSSLETKPGMIKGKIIYMAPEQIDEELGPVDAQSDIFAVGLVLHEMLSGSASFRRETEMAAMRAVLQAPIAHVGKLRGDITNGLDAIIARAVERDRTKRYQSAEELKLDLENELAASGSACTSTHVGRWLLKLVDTGRKIGVIAPAPHGGETPTGITQELGHDSEGVFASQPNNTGVDDSPTVQHQVDPRDLKKTVKG